MEVLDGRLFCAGLTWIYRLLIEQCEEEVPAPTTKPELLRMSKLVLAAWLLMGVVITNAYRGIIKSDYILNYPFATRWERSSELLALNFSLFYARRGLDCGSSEPPIFTEFGLFEWRVNDFAIKYPPFTRRLTNAVRSAAMDCFASGCEPMASPKWSVRFQDSPCRAFAPCKEYARIAELMSRTRLTCAAQLPPLKRTRLSQPETVLIVSAPDFEFFWNLFKGEMKCEPELGLKFAHNRGVDDDYFSEPQWWVLRRDLDPQRPLVELRGMADAGAVGDVPAVGGKGGHSV
jgi:hypothetical protein